MVGGGWINTHNLVKPTLLVKVELGFDNCIILGQHAHSIELAGVDLKHPLISITSERLLVKTKYGIFQQQTNQLQLMQLLLIVVK